MFSPLPGKTSLLTGFVAACVFVMIIIMLFIMPAALACSGCSVNYPFLHDFPSAEELEGATHRFAEEYRARMLHQYRDLKLGETWYLKLEREGIEAQYATFEVILCYKEEFYNDGLAGSSYHYTMLEYDEERGYYFRPYSMGSFPHREELAAYLDEFVIARLENQKAVALPGPAVLQAGKTRVNLKALFVILGLIAGFLSVRYAKMPGKRG